MRKPYVEPAARTLLGLILAAATLGLFVMWSGWTGSSPLPQILAPATEDEEMVTWTASWRSENVEHTVTTVWKPGGELTVAEAREIHNTEVALQKAEFVPDPA